MKKRRRSPNLPQDEGTTRPHYFGSARRAPIILGVLVEHPLFWVLSKHQRAPIHFPILPPPTYLQHQLIPPPPPYLGQGGTTPPSPKPRLRKHTWGMMASVCGLWPQCGQLETTQATTLKSGSGRTSLQFLNLPG